MEENSIITRTVGDEEYVAGESLSNRSLNA